MIKIATALYLSLGLFIDPKPAIYCLLTRSKLAPQVGLEPTTL